MLHAEIALLTASDSGTSSYGYRSIYRVRQKNILPFTWKFNANGVHFLPHLVYTGKELVESLLCIVQVKNDPQHGSGSYRKESFSHWLRKVSKKPQLQLNLVENIIQHFCSAANLPDVKLHCDRLARREVG